MTGTTPVSLRQFMSSKARANRKAPTGRAVPCVLSCPWQAEQVGTAPMSDFAVKIEGRYATATHHASGHVFEFSIACEPPYLRGGAVRENRKAERGPDSLWGAAQAAVLKE